MVRRTIHDPLDDIGWIVGSKVPKGDFRLPTASGVTSPMLQRTEIQGPAIDVLRVLALDNLTPPEAMNGSKEILL